MPGVQASAGHFPSVILGNNAPALDWLQENRHQAKEALAAHGSILLRGFQIELEDLEPIALRIADVGLIAYEHGSTPRTRIGEFTYTSTEYPPRATIAQHSECSYQDDWPTLLFFYCKTPAPTGGNTPIALLRTVTDRLPLEIVLEFERREVMYVRNYYPGLEPSWQSAFGTASRDAVETYCRNHGITCRWTGDDSLSTAQRCQGVIKDRVTGEKLWFNQAHLFHVSALDSATQEALLEIYAPSELPRTAYFGDGSELDPDVLEYVRRAFELETTRFDWRPQDLLVLDNMRVSHGRDPYAGPREIYVAMADLWSEVGSGPAANTIG